MKLKNFVYKNMKDQFIVNDIYEQDVAPFAITESTPNPVDDKHKVICLDFGDINGVNESRYIPVDVMIMILKDFYGTEFLEKAVKEVKPYDEVKDK